MRVFVLLLLAAAALPGQGIDFGIRAGVPIGDAFEAARDPLRITGRQQFLIGPTLELRLPFGLGASFDVLYRRYKIEESGGGTIATGAQWEFPLMFRYRFPGILARPFIGAGPTFNRITGITAIRESTNGFVAGAGVEVKVPVLRFTPELRYSRIAQGNSATVQGATLRQHPNRWDVLVGITF